MRDELKRLQGKSSPVKRQKRPCEVENAANVEILPLKKSTFAAAAKSESKRSAALQDDESQHSSLNYSQTDGDNDDEKETTAIVFPIPHKIEEEASASHNNITQNAFATFGVQEEERRGRTRYKTPRKNKLVSSPAKAATADQCV